LEDEGEDFLYHANTVRTSATFLRQGALLSRGTIEDSNLDQTEQDSDSLDKDVGLWYDIFLDTGDISTALGERNKYGPVKFKISKNILKTDKCSCVWVTRLNPIHWGSSNELKDQFIKNEYLDSNSLSGSYFWERALVLRHCGGRLPFEDYLEKIIIDDPVRPVFPTEDSEDKSREYFASAYALILNAVRVGKASGKLQNHIDGRYDRKSAKQWYADESNEDLRKWFFG